MAFLPNIEQENFDNNSTYIGRSLFQQNIKNKKDRTQAFLIHRTPERWKLLRFLGGPRVLQKFHT